jgi:hypothetical protein
MVVVLCNPGQSVYLTLQIFILFTRVELGNTSFIKLPIALIRAFRSTAASATLPRTAIHLSYECGCSFIFLLTGARVLCTVFGGDILAAEFGRSFLFN